MEQRGQHRHAGLAAFAALLAAGAVDGIEDRQGGARRLVIGADGGDDAFDDPGMGPVPLGRLEPARPVRPMAAAVSGPHRHRVALDQADVHQVAQRLDDVLELELQDPAQGAGVQAVKAQGAVGLEQVLDQPEAGVAAPRLALGDMDRQGEGRRREVGADAIEERGERFGAPGRGFRKRRSRRRGRIGAGTGSYSYY